MEMKRFCCAAASALSLGVVAQEIVPCGDGSYASYTPWSKARTVDKSRWGDQSRFMQNRPLYMTARRKGDPLPTNDWWTDAFVNQWTGNLWSYPGLVRCTAGGVSVAFPSYWIDNGTEMKAKSRLVFGADAFAPVSAAVDDWHDWDVSLLLRDGKKAMRATLVHGSPFTWIEYVGVEPTLSIDAEGGVEPVRTKRGDGELIVVGDDSYGVWRGKTASGSWVAVGLLPSAKDFDRLAPYASAIIRETRVDWSYDEKRANLKTTWRVTTEDLRGKVKDPVALQGFQPHHLKHTKLDFKTIDGLVWQTPRGKQRAAAGNALSVTYPFNGLIPYWAVPATSAKGEAFDGKYHASVLKTLLADYAARGGFGGDTYWGGKGLLQMAMAMMAARELGDEETYKKAHDRLREKFEDWLTWTPGEERFYFSYVPRWGGLVGESTSYDSDTFNDHHFHYGYFTYAGALLCLVDDDFKDRFGSMLKLIASDYANWNRDEKRFPLFRTFDPWAGHSFAGGMGDGAGNGQESSSEAMQGWGGLYLLGVALGDDAMRDAGIFGYVSEARGTAEYWFDRDRENIDYTKYTKPYNSNLTCHGVGWWTFFSGDPVWMHSIQWLPNTPMLDYLSEDLKFAAWDYDTMWKTKEITGWEKELGDASLGNVILSYLQRSRPQEAAKIFDDLRKDNRGVYKNADTGHMTYWAIHSHLAWGELDWNVRADSPLARAYLKDGKHTFVVYNNEAKPRTVTFFDEKGEVIGSVTAKPRQLTVGGVATKPLAPFAAPEKKASLVPDGVMLPDLAAGKRTFASSQENAGLAAVNLTDGDDKSRWGSAHSDEEMTAGVDLGESAQLYAVELHWENAHASRYVIEASTDGSTWKAIGGERSGSAGIQRLTLNGERASQVRIRALEKAIPQFGVSLFRFSVYGRPASAKASTPLGLVIESDKPVLKEGAKNALRVKAWYGGTKFAEVPVTWTTTDGAIDASGTFVPALADAKQQAVSVTATANGLSVTRAFPVEEALRAVSLTLEPATVELAVGDTVRFIPRATDQFGGKMPLKGAKLQKPTVGKLQKGFVYTASKPGKTTVGLTLGELAATSTIEVKPLSEVDLARKAKVIASSAENDGTKAEFAIDGDPKTRWGSGHKDGEWIQLDLGKAYTLATVELDWENARAVDYDILASADGSSWQTIAEVRDGKGGLEKPAIKSVKARFVKVVGLKRNTTYGISLFRLSVFAKGK